METRSKEIKNKSEGQKIVKGTLSLLGLQLGTRAITFLLNIVVIRHTDPEVFAFVILKLDLYLAALLFISREGQRVSVHKLVNSHFKTNQDNLSLLIGLSSIINGIVVAILVIIWQGPKNFGNDYSALVLYLVAGIIELFTEPLYLHFQLALVYGIRVKAEAVGFFCKSIGTILFIWWKNSLLGPLPFAIGQLFYASSILIIYTWKYFSDISTSRMVWSKLSKEEVGYIFQHKLHSLFQFGQTHADKLALSIFMQLDQSSVYLLISNYTAILARIVFAPIEENIRVFFSRNRNTKNGQSKSLFLLYSLLHIYILGSIIIVVVTPPMVITIISSLSGPKWKSVDESSNNTLVRLCIYYIPFLAINGIMEAYVHAISSPKVLARSYFFMIFLSNFYVFSSYILIDVYNMSSSGLVLSNILNMGLRIIWSSYIVKKNGSKSSIPIFPNILVFISSIISFILQGTGGKIDNFEKAKSVLIHASVLIIISAISENKFIYEIYCSLRNDEVATKKYKKEKSKIK